MRALFVAALFCGFATAAGAQTSLSQPLTPEALANVYRCAEEQADAARLACYDAAVGRLQQAQNEGQLVAVDRQQVANIERESFGFRLPSFASMIPRIGDDDGDPGLDEIQLTVERVSARAHGRYAFVMTDGQVWTQVQAQRPYNVRAGDTVTIRRAALGSYMLAPSRSGAAHRVRREE